MDRKPISFPVAPLLYRHGDVLVAAVECVPADAEPMPGLVLARGEATGHAHRIAEADGRARLHRAGALTFVEIVGTAATLVHDEHGPIALTPGVYRFWKQREYVPAGKDGRVEFRPVAD